MTDDGSRTWVGIITVHSLLATIFDARHARLLAHQSTPAQPARLLMHPHTWADLATDPHGGWVYSPSGLTSRNLHGIPVTRTTELHPGIVIIIWEEDAHG